MWQKAADMLKYGALNNGLKIDPTCTADRARILRIPGFVNNKNGNVVHSVYPLDGDTPTIYTQDEILEGLTPFYHCRPPSLAARETSVYAAPVVLSQADRDFGFTEADSKQYPEHSWDKAKLAIEAGNCPLIATAMQNQGDVGYDLWTGLLSLAQCMADPEAMIEDTCGDHPQYDLQECLQKAASFYAPRTCMGMETAAVASGFGPSPCAGCPNKGRFTSPVQLDRVRVNAPTEVEVTLPTGETAMQTLAALPAPYKTGGQSGIYTTEFKVVEKGLGDNGGTLLETEVRLMREDIRLVGVSRLGDGADQVMAYKFEFVHKIQGMQRFSLSAKEFSGSKGDTVISKLMNANVDVSNPTSIKDWHIKVSKFLSALITQYTDVKAAPLTVTQFGPQHEGDTSFVLGEYRYNVDGSKDIVNLTPTVEYAAEHMPAPPTTDAGKQHRADLIAEWNTQLKEVLPHDTHHAIDRFVLASGFATALSPYITPTRVRGGMMVINYNGSGSGKSTMVERATHIWSGGDAKFITPNTTQMQFLENRVQVANALPTAWDELCKEDDNGAKLLASLALCSTDRKQRERKYEINKGTWNTWFYATMNPDPHALLGSRGLASDGALHRVLSLKTDPARFGTGENLRTAQKKAHLLEKWGHKNGGHVGTAWVEYFLPKLDHLRDRYEFWERRFQTECPDLFKGSGERFAVAICVTTMVAAEAAKDAGLHPFNIDGLFAYAQVALGSSIENIGQHTIQDEEILDLLLATSQEFMVIKDDKHFGPNDRQPNKSVDIRVDTANNEPTAVSISKRYIKDWAAGKKIDASRVMRAIKKIDGVTTERVYMTKGFPTAIVRATCLVIPASSMGVDRVAELFESERT
jgi:hypothetical protein